VNESVDETTSAHQALRNPAQATEKAPDTYRVRFQTTKGEFAVEVSRAWAPLGADRFYNLVTIGYLDGCKFFRAIEGFMVQFGISGNPDVARAWREATIRDDKVVETNTAGRVTFATAGPHTRTTQLFINYGNNARLDGMGFAPLGEVVEGMDVVRSLYTGYGEGAPSGRGPDQGSIQKRGNAYLEERFPLLDGITRATVEG
jgi:peptidyl-prolyl cis-trans isomerase A (cyclophilin A)